MKVIWSFFQDEILGMKWLNRLIGSVLEAVGLDTLVKRRACRFEYGGKIFAYPVSLLSSGRSDKCAGFGIERYLTGCEYHVADVYTLRIRADRCRSLGCRNFLQHDNHPFLKFSCIKSFYSLR